MKERPILFTPENAQKVHDGTKTQTRRIVSSRHIKFLSTGVMMPRDFADIGSFTPVGATFEARLEKFNMIVGLGVCPHGVPGDRLWVRESIFLWGEWVWAKKKDGKTGARFRCLRQEAKYHDAPPRVIARGRGGPGWYKRSSIHMPRWACRTVLEIAEVRVQRVRDISDHDCKAEGLRQSRVTPFWWGPEGGKSPRHGFSIRWDSINGEGAWARNDRVWALTFKRVEGEP